MMRGATKSGGHLLMAALSVTVCAATLAAIPAPAHAQGTDLKELMAGTKYPLSIKLKDMNAEWRRLSVAGLSGANPMTAMFNMGDVDALYTKGEMVTLGTETFIVAYRPPAAKVDFMTMMRQGPAAAPPEAEKLTPATSLDLTFINLRTVSSLSAIRPFALQQEIAQREGEIANARERMAQMAGPQGPQAQNVNQVSLSNMKQLALGMMQYLQDFDETYPKMEDAEALKALIMPYVKAEAIFMHPATRELYQPNPALSGKKMAQIADPAAMVLFYEASASGDGTRGVAYADGHCKRVAEAEWPQIKRASRIP